MTLLHPHLALVQSILRFNLSLSLCAFCKPNISSPKVIITNFRSYLLHSVSSISSCKRILHFHFALQFPIESLFFSTVSYLRFPLFSLFLYALICLFPDQSLQILPFFQPVIVIRCDPFRFACCCFFF